MKKDDKKRKPKVITLESGSGLSIRQWELLRQKDPTLLSDLEKRQLEATNKLAAEAIKKFGEAYDLSPMVEVLRAFQTAPINRAVREATRMTEQLSSLGRSIALPIESLVAFQKSYIALNDSLNKQIAEMASAALATRMMFDSFQSLHTRITKSLSVDIASLGRSVRFSEYEEVKLDLQTVNERDGYISVSGLSSQIRRVDDYSLVHNADLSFLFTELKANRSEIAEVKQLITGPQSGVSKITYADATFRRAVSRMVFKSINIVVQGSSHQADFCDLFFSSPENFSKKWDIEEFMHQAFGWLIDVDGSETSLKSRLEGYANTLNQKITAATQGKFEKFFVVQGIHVFINPTYI